MQQEWLDREFLASTHVGTPDPRQENPPKGHRLLVAWRFPNIWMDMGLKMQLTVRFWDDLQESICRPIDDAHGHTVFDFRDRRILTYEILILDKKGDCLEVWEHQFWTKLIDVDRRRDTVSSQPIQGSVIETP